MAVLKSRLRHIAKEAGPAANRALMRTAVDVYDISQQLVPVDKGLLRDSGGVEPLSSNHVVVGYGLPGSEREDVAIFQEYGTVNQDAQPYLTPAFAQAGPTLEARLLEEVKKIT